MFPDSFLNIVLFGVGFGQRIRFLKVDFSQLIVETFVKFPQQDKIEMIVLTVETS